MEVSRAMRSSIFSASLRSLCIVLMSFGISSKKQWCLIVFAKDKAAKPTLGSIWIDGVDLTMNSPKNHTNGKEVIMSIE